MSPTTPENKLYEDTLRAAWAIVNVLLSVEVEAMHERAEHALTVGPIVDPTLFRAGGELVRCDADMLAVLATAKAKLAPLVKRREAAEAARNTRSR